MCACVCAWSCGSLGPVGDGSRSAAVVISLTFTSGQEGGQTQRHFSLSKTIKRHIRPPNLRCQLPIYVVVLGLK